MSNIILKTIAATSLAAIVSIPPSLSAETKSVTMQHTKGMDHSTMNHDQMMKSDGTEKSDEQLPLEPGQGAFATVAEIVVMLTNDPSTDWSKVDINGLREHLIDMDELILRANAKTEVADNKVTFTVSGSGRALQAIRAMVPAHSEVLSRTTAWQVESELTDNGAIMTVSSDNSMALKVVEALGFYGVMATGAHHQAHHLAMAKGDTHAHSHN